MRCPRCFLADIPEGARACVLCGYAPEAAATDASAQPTPPARPGRGRRTTPVGGSTPTDPRGSPAPPAVAGEAHFAPTELDARRQLSARPRTRGVFRGSPER